MILMSCAYVTQQSLISHVNYDDITYNLANYVAGVKPRASIKKNVVSAATA